jgi:hypothetical protein
MLLLAATMAFQWKSFAARRASKTFARQIHDPRAFSVLL